MLAFVVDLLAGVYYVHGYYQYSPEYIGITQSFPFLYGPCIYLYVIILGHKQEGFKKNYWLHYLPFLLVNIYGIFFFYFEDTAYKLAFMNVVSNRPWHIILISSLIPLHGTVYTLLTIRETLKFNKLLKNSYSNIDKINLSWLTLLTIGAAIIWFIVIISYIFAVVLVWRLESNYLIYVALSILIYTLGFKSLMQPEVNIIDDTSTQLSGENLKSSSYKKSGLTDETAKEYLQKLLQVEVAVFR